MKRRNFVKQTSSFVSLPFLLQGLPLSASSGEGLANAFDEDNDKILILIQLNGGNDGLNTIIPLDKYDILGNARQNILIPESQVLKASEEIAFHPSMEGIRSLFDEGYMTVLQDVGYPNQNRSHFRSTDIWHSASPSDEVWITGWLGRYLENDFRDYPDGFPNSGYPDPFALTIGSVVSETCQGTLTNFSLALADPLSISPLSDSMLGADLDTPYGKELDFLRKTIEQANAYGEVIKQAAEVGSNTSGVYPETPLGNQLRAISLLISGGLKTKIYIANLGGFDTHANQTSGGDPREGEHAELLSTLSEAIEALQRDLTSQGLEERVVTMTFSEFGRRIRSNASFGTDHGTAAPMMIFGSCINPGFIGNSPTLPDRPEVGDGVPMQIDFRSIYTSLLIDWLGADPTVISEVMGEEFAKIPVINVCNEMTTPTDDVTIANDSLVTFPNPFSRWLSLDLESKGEHTSISLFDAIGHQVDVITNRTLSTGSHTIKYDGSHLSAGNYFIRMQTPQGASLTNVIKVD